MRTRDGGRSWRGIPAPRAPLGEPDSGRNGAVSVLRFADDANGWAGVGQLYSTHDGGASWRRLRIGTSTSVVSAIETGGGYVYATIDGCPSQGSNSCTPSARVYASTIGSDRWSAITPTLRGGGLGALVVHGQDWYLPTSKGVYRGRGRSAPTRLANPCPAEEGRRAAPAIAVADTAHLDALCLSQGAVGSATYQLFGSTDAGRSWQKAGGPHREPSGVYGITDNSRGVLLVAAASGLSEILRTTDDGATFTRASAPAPAGGIAWADLGFTTSSQAVVILQNTAMYLSHDSGATFHRVVF